MKYKICLFLLLLSSVGTENIFSQISAPLLKDNPVRGETEQTFQIGEVRGNIKRKAIYLPKPSFPREALEAGADGIVKVQVVIAADGNVVSAEMIAGHPLLKSAAEETALKTKFRKAATDDQNAKETGIIIYNFAIEKASWLRIGYDLTIIQKAPTLRPFNVPRIAKAFQPEWTDEKEILEKIAELRRIELETQNGNSADDKPVFVKKSGVTSDGSLQKRVTGEIRLPVVNPPSGERIALSQNLTALLQSRLATDESSLWKFNLGVNLIKSFETSRNPREWQNAAQILKQSAETAPTDISPEALAALQSLIKIYESGKRTAETPNEIGRSMTILFKIK